MGSINSKQTGSKEQTFNKNLTEIIAAGSVERLKELLKTESNINEQDELGRTVLCKAIVLCAKPEMIQTLIELGADANISSKDGVSPLHVATVRNNIETVNVLLKHQGTSSLVNKQTKYGMTALHCAANHGYLKVASLLLENGANMGIQEYKYGYSIWDVALETKNKEIINFFKSHNYKRLVQKYQSKPEKVSKLIEMESINTTHKELIDSTNNVTSSCL